MNLDSNVVGPGLLLCMFVMSGINKMLTFDKTVKNVQGKLNVTETISKLGVYLVILLEILAPLIIMYYIIFDKYKTYALYSVFGLIIFTIVVTMIYHPPKINYYDSIAFWANVSLLGGLLLLKSRLTIN
jgi:uncharacterized membrane protein YphA (DoxX/SURF4 family)